MKKCIALLLAALLLVPSYAAAEVPSYIVDTENYGIIRGIGESLGATYTQESLKAQINHIEAMAYDGDTHAQNLVNHINTTIPHEVDSNGNNVYVWEPSNLFSYLPAFIQSVYDMGGAIGDIMNGDSHLDNYGQGISIYGKNGSILIGPFQPVQGATWGNVKIEIHDGLGNKGSVTTTAYKPLTLLDYVVTKPQSTQVSLLATYGQGEISPNPITHIITVPSAWSLSNFNGFSVQEKPITREMMPNISNVPNQVWENVGNTTYYGDTWTVVQNNDDFSKTYNEPLSDDDITNIFNPPVVVVPVEPPVVVEPVPDDFTGIMSYMGGKVIDTYNGIVTFSQNAVTGMQSLLVSTTGLVTFLGHFFGFLPDEFVTIMTVGFMMSFIAFFFRR